MDNGIFRISREGMPTIMQRSISKRNVSFYSDKVVIEYRRKHFWNFSYKITSIFLTEQIKFLEKLD